MLIGGKDIVVDGILLTGARTLIGRMFRAHFPSLVVVDANDGVIITYEPGDWNGELLIYENAAEIDKDDKAHYIHLFLGGSTTTFVIDEKRGEDEKFVADVVEALRANHLIEERKIHPRYGYVVALYYGVQGRLDVPMDKILIEVHETYNVWGQESSKNYHYRPYHLGPRMMKGEIKTVGFIDPPVEGSELPPKFVQGQYGGYHWTRLR